MSELILELDNKAEESIKSLMSHYNIGDKGRLISKAISLLKIAAQVDKTEGELFARKEGRETKILVK
jgi:hypothetical protein